MTTPRAIIDDACTTLAAVATSRDSGELFLQHLSNLPFEATPKSKRDGFEVIERDYDQTAGFGVLGEKETAFTMVVRLGHAPFGTDKVREQNRVDDVERIVDIFEAHAWPVGTFKVLHEGPPTVDKRKANWWLTELQFRVVLTGAIRT